MGSNAIRATGVFVSAFLLFGGGHHANAQALSVNPSAAASEVRNPSSINPAAAASEIRNPSAFNPAARGSQIQGPGVISLNRPAGIAPAVPRQRIAPSVRPSSVDRAMSPPERPSTPDKADFRSARPSASEVPDTNARSDNAAKAHDEQYKKWDAAAKHATGSICNRCGSATASPTKRTQKPQRKTRSAG